MNIEQLAELVQQKDALREEAAEQAEREVEELEKLMDRMAFVSRILNTHAQHIVLAAERAGFIASRRDIGEYWCHAKYDAESFGWPGYIEVRCLREAMVLRLSADGWTAGQVAMGPDTPETIEHIKLNMRMLSAFAINQHGLIPTYGGPYFQPAAPTKESIK